MSRAPFQAAAGRTPPRPTCPRASPSSTRCGTVRSRRSQNQSIRRPARADAMLRLTNVQVRYSGALLGLNGLSLNVPEGHIVALLGANGAGKSTTLKAISGLLKSDGGQVTEGNVEFNGRSIMGLDPAAIVRLGMFQVMEGRRVFQHLSVEDNLRAGAHTRGRKTFAHDLEQVYGYFPRLKERRRGAAGYLSGGEQQ